MQFNATARRMQSSAGNYEQSVHRFPMGEDGKEIRLGGVAGT